MTLAARLSAIAVPAMFAAASAAAMDIQVPADQPTIQQGIDAAVAGDRVLVAPGTYFEHINFGGRDIQVIGTGGPSVTTIDGGGIDRVVLTRVWRGRRRTPPSSRGSRSSLRRGPNGTAATPATAARSSSPADRRRSRAT